MKILKIFFLLLLTVPLLAQEDAEEAIQSNPKARAKIRAAHAAYITERLGLTPDEAEKFWPVYREYAQKRQQLKQQFKDARKSGTDEKALLELELKIKQQQLDLEKDYSGRFQEIITPQKVIILRQAERDFIKLVFRQIRQRRHQRDRQQPRLQQRNN